MSFSGGSGGTFRALRSRNFRLYQSGMAVSAIGVWMQFIGQDWLVLDLTKGSGSALGVTTALQFVPFLAFGLWGGIIADRFPKRRILVITQTATGVLALILGVLTVTGVVRLWHVFALALAVGLTKSVDNPTTQSFVVELVGPADRGNAIALQSAVMTSGRLVGTAVAGLLINLVGVGVVFLLNGLSFTGVILGLALMRRDELHDAPRASRIKGQLSAGLSYIRGRGDLLLIFALVAFVSTFGMNPQITTALMAKNVFHAGAGTFGLASTAFAVGSLVGALLAARAANLTKRMMLGAALLFGVLEAASALSPAYIVFLVMLVLTGLMMVVFNTAVIAILQIDVAPEMRGRINGLFVLVFNGTTPIGAPVIGWLAQEFGARASLAAAGVVSVLAAVAVAPPLARRGLAAEGRVSDLVEQGSGGADVSIG